VIANNRFLRIFKEPVEAIPAIERFDGIFIKMGAQKTSLAGG